ncbi:Hypothetical protein FKW44_023510 [Caligus rogercresseyi]|uniref:Uncharacterized protein n=1 Tax=Caligus rogercresseyi TaxID=217165 RepID=A0A7T8GPN1_CALRO|nr:Hypothetical protein FKW44_023353 [Caligus rogercresseyi]QQP35327.1 Hypothetical protein FKW44_023510 [Caligus rogercresseyi]
MKWPAVSLISEPNAKVTNIAEGLTLSSTGLVRWDAFVAGSSAAAKLVEVRLSPAFDVDSWRVILYIIQMYRDRGYTPHFTSRRIGSAFKDHVSPGNIHELPQGFDWDQELMMPRLGTARTYSYVTDQIIIPCLTSFQNVNTRFLRSLTNYHSIDVNRGGILLPKQINGLSIPGASIDANALFGLGPAPTPSEKAPRSGGKPKASGPTDKTKRAAAQSVPKRGGAPGTGDGDDKPDPDVPEDKEDPADEEKGEEDVEDDDATSGSGGDEDASTESDDGPALAISTPKPGPSGLGKKRAQDKKAGEKSKGPPAKKGRPESKRKAPGSKETDEADDTSSEAAKDKDPAQEKFDTMSEKVELEVLRLTKSYVENNGDIIAALADLSETAATDPANIGDALAGLEGAFSAAEDVPPALNTARRRMERTVKAMQIIAKKQAEQAAKKKKAPGKTSGPPTTSGNSKTPAKTRSQSKN